MTSLFTPEVVVPDKLVAVTPALRKKCSKIRGTAGPSRARLIWEIAKQKKTSISKICFANDPVAPVKDPVPPLSARDASPLPTACADNLIVPTPNCQHHRRMRTPPAGRPSPLPEPLDTIRQVQS